MSFLGGVLLGLPVAIGFVVLFARYSNIRSTSRSHLAKTVAAFARMTLDDSKTILSPQFYPSWLVFSQRQKLDWLNLQLEKIWPYVNEASSELIKSNVEAILEEYRPPILASLNFSKLTLGSVAPRFTGVQIVEDGSEDVGVTMELEVQWDGNPKIVLSIKTILGVTFPVKVKDIGFTGVFRLTFKPLVNDLPCFGAVSYSLREKKQLSFELKISGGDVTSIPGISDVIEETIIDAIEDSILWPARKIIPILPGDYSHLELKAVGKLDVKLVQGKDLANKDFIGKSDPYAVLFVRPLRDRIQRSKTINNELDPIWNEHFEMIVEDVSTQHLTIRVFDDEGIQSSQLVGVAHVPLKDLDPCHVKVVWLKLFKDLNVQRDTKYRGQVQLELLYCPNGMESTFKNPFDPNYSLTLLEKLFKPSETSISNERDVIVRGVLSVTVIAAQDLPAQDFKGKADPFVLLIMKKSEAKAKTRVVKENLNPVWNQTFEFVVEDALHELLILEVWDHDTCGKEKLGRCIMTLTKVMLEGESQDMFPLDGSNSGTLHLRLKWTPKLKLRQI